MKLTFSVFVANEVIVDVNLTVVNCVLSEDRVCVHVTVKWPVSVTVTVAFGRGQQSLQADLFGSIAYAFSKGWASTNNSIPPFFSKPCTSSAGRIFCRPPVVDKINPSRTAHQDPTVIQIYYMRILFDSEVNNPVLEPTRLFPWQLQRGIGPGLLLDSLSQLD